jgi:uncharacterized membrane protein
MDIRHKHRSRITTTPRVLLGMALAVGLLVPFTSAVAQATPASDTVTYQMVPLPVPDGTTSSSVNGGDPTGRYLVGTAHPGNFTGLVWRHGRMTEIDGSVLQPSVGVSFNDVNRHGVVTGERTTDNSTFHTDAFIYRAGQFTMLPALNPGDETRTVAINSRGDVVGDTFTATGWHPVVWPADQPGTVRVLTMPDGQPANAFASDIDEDGTVVGYLAPNPPGIPYVWPANGTPRPLPIPADSSGGGTTAIRLGMVAGGAFHPVGAGMSRSVPTLWNLRTGSRMMWTDLETGVLSVNRWGTLGLVGAVLHADGRLVPVAPGAMVEVITDRGLAAGSTSWIGGQAVIWIER